MLHQQLSMTHKPNKVYVFRIKVLGRGDFPVDMLRYDRCVPERSEDVFSVDTRNDGRSVQLLQYCLTKAGPTVDRWKSFGWSVDSVEAITLG